MCNQVLIYPPKYPQNLATATSFSLFAKLAAWLEQHCCDLKVTVGQQGVCLSPSCFPPMVSLAIPFPSATRAALSPSLTIGAPQASPLLPLQIHESLSLQTALESSPNCSSSLRALGSRSSWWIVFLSLGACSLPARV